MFLIMPFFFFLFRSLGTLDREKDGNSVSLSVVAIFRDANAMSGCTVLKILLNNLFTVCFLTLFLEFRLRSMCLTRTILLRCSLMPSTLLFLRHSYQDIRYFRDNEPLSLFRAFCDISYSPFS